MIIAWDTPYDDEVETLKKKNHYGDKESPIKNLQGINDYINSSRLSPKQC